MEKRILIVDDEPDIREAMAEAVSQAGFTVMTAENGMVGLQMALTEHPDLVLLDLVMPIMNGHEVLRKMREDSWGRNAKVLVLTSMDDATSVANAHSGDINDYIIKAHASLEEIVKHVRMALYSAD